MKKTILTLFSLFITTFIFSQSNKEIASVYIKRATESLNNLEIKRSLVDFNKAMKYTDTIISADVAKLGTQINYELSNYAEAKVYCKQYFLLVKNKKTEEYAELLELSVDINEEIELGLKEQQRIEEERLKKEKELQRIDSLKTVWQTKSESLSIKVDSLYNFNKNNLALYTNNNLFGIINDLGEIIIEAKEYEDAISFDGFIILKNKINNPTKLYCFNTNTNSGFLIPNISDFNTRSTHFGQVMLPRANGRLVTYPNNSKEPFVYDLNLKKNVRIANQKELFKDLKKNDIIDKYNSDGEVKKGKVWYVFGGHLGGGIHPLYAEEGYDLKAFLFSIDGKILDTASGYKYLGAFYNSKSQAFNGTNTSWLNQNGTKVSDAKDEAENYKGNSKVIKLENGAYQIIQDGVIILGKERLEKIGIFLRSLSN